MLQRYHHDTVPLQTRSEASLRVTTLTGGTIYNRRPLSNGFGLLSLVLFVSTGADLPTQIVQTMDTRPRNSTGADAVEDTVSTEKPVTTSVNPEYTYITTGYEKGEVMRFTAVDNANAHRARGQEQDVDDDFRQGCCSVLCGRSRCGMGAICDCHAYDTSGCIVA